MKHYILLLPGKTTESGNIPQIMLFRKYETNVYIRLRDVLQFNSHTNQTNGDFLNLPTGTILVRSRLFSSPFANVYMTSWLIPDNAACVDSLQP